MDLGNSMEQVQSWGGIVPVLVGGGLMAVILLLTVIKVAWWAALFVFEQLVAGLVLKWLTGWSETINDFARDIPAAASYTALAISALAVAIPAMIMSPRNKGRAVAKKGIQEGTLRLVAHGVSAAGGLALFLSAGHELLLEYVPAGLYVTAQSVVEAIA